MEFVPKNTLALYHIGGSFLLLAGSTMAVHWWSGRMQLEPVHLIYRQCIFSPVVLLVHWQYTWNRVYMWWLVSLLMGDPVREVLRVISDRLGMCSTVSFRMDICLEGGSALVFN